VECDVLSTGAVENVSRAVSQRHQCAERRTLDVLAGGVASATIVWSAGNEVLSGGVESVRRGLQPAA